MVYYERGRACLTGGRVNILKFVVLYYYVRYTSCLEDIVGGINDKTDLCEILLLNFTYNNGHLL